MEQAVKSQTDWDVQFKASSLLASPPGGPHPIPPTKGKRGRGLFLFSLVICVVQQDSLNHNYPGLLLPDISWLPMWLEGYPLKDQNRAGAATGHRVARREAGRAHGALQGSLSADPSERHLTLSGEAVNLPSEKGGGGESEPRAEETQRESLNLSIGSGQLRKIYGVLSRSPPQAGRIVKEEFGEDSVTWFRGRE